MEPDIKLIKVLEQIIINHQAKGNMASCVLDTARIALKNCGFDVRVFYTYEPVHADFIQEMEEHYILEAKLDVSED